MNVQQITETLERVTQGDDQPSPEKLRATLTAEIPAEADYPTLRQHPLAVWVELNLGLRLEAGKWARARPRLAALPARIDRK